MVCGLSFVVYGLWFVEDSCEILGTTTCLRFGPQSTLGSDLCKMILSLIVFVKYKKIMQMFLNIRIK